MGATPDPPAAPTPVTSLGTGSFLAAGRCWNGFVVDGSVLVEPSPTALPHLRRCGLTAEALEVVVISHLGAGVDVRHIDDCLAPDDLQTLEL